MDFTIANALSLTLEVAVVLLGSEASGSAS